MDLSNAQRRGWVGLDIGGANIKAAHEGGQVRNIPFEVWKRPDELGQAISSVVSALPEAGRAAVTMTAELCDCYSTKTVGVNAVLDAVVTGLPRCSIVVWGIDGEFHTIAEVRRNPLSAAAANWLALAELAARLIPKEHGLLIDIGTTTTDLIPLERGKVAARGRSDTERLQTGELVYAGVRRTPVCALATELPVRGIATDLAAEFFASTLDVFLILGDVDSDPADLSTADGRPVTVEAARDRLARMVGADRDGFNDDDARDFAHAAQERLINRLAAAVERASTPTIGRPTAAVVAGSGEFLARRLALHILDRDSPVISLTDAWGSMASSAGCAYAVVKLAAERFRMGSDGACDSRTGLVLEANPE
jgi:probable H4MPT-linked C1 transfer pathway protein